ncbi:hypothetical protein FQR65_LT00062 [Abscondita terminalis]|nr:hypothetical protein FQR65_LT00062 [Abscondita terminalis]
MKQNYQTTTPRDLLQSRNKDWTPKRSKRQRKRLELPSTPHLQNGSSVSPSSPAVVIEDSKPKPPPLRQNSNSISTDNSGAAVKTINNIFNGITDSFNRLSHEKDYNLQYAYVEQPFSKDLAAISGKPFSPRLKKRLHEQQKKVEELARETQIVALNDIKIQTSCANIPYKETPLEKWSKQVKGRVKSGLKKATSKINAKDVQTSYKKRRGVVKRLMSTSKISDPINASNVQFRKFGANYSTDNLIELYHNVAAKFSGSDVSNHVNRLDSKQGAGDVYPNATFTSYVSDDKSGTHLMQSSKALPPIDENMVVKRDYLQRILRNYESHTIASKLKRVTKNYLRSFNYFNFRCIPFCAAKSTSPSHNIGINIQQVMSIIKSKQPMGGISPTLAHNMHLAAEKLQGSPLSALVSNLNTRIGSINSTCPLVKHINFTKLQELAKTIPEEPLEEEEVHPTEVCSNNMMDTTTTIIESPPMVPPIWSAAPGSSRCTCTTQKGVPFQKVLNKYKIATSEIDPLSVKQKPKIYANPRQIHTANYKKSKQRTADWLSSGVKENVSLTCNIAEPSHEAQQQNELRGREKNLKTVLKNLHDEFDNLNMKYEELSKSSTKSNPQTVKLLDDMEQQLNKKEDEINMVMSLYTEVMALKDQVKKMKERSSNETIPGEKGETIPALHLTHLLHKIQNYQNRFPNK